MQEVRIRDVVGYFVVGMFGLALLIFTGVANFSLLMSIYPDPQFVGFGLCALEGGTIAWTLVYFLTSTRSHKGICIIGLGVDTLLSFAGFMYELSHMTHTSLLVQLPVMYVIGFAVVFNVSVALAYKLIPTGTRIEYHPPAWAKKAVGGVIGTTVVQTTPHEQSVISSNTEEIPAISSNNERLLRIAEAAEKQHGGLDRLEGMLGLKKKA